jgi:hypothetical protein
VPPQYTQPFPDDEAFFPVASTNEQPSGLQYTYNSGETYTPGLGLQRAPNHVFDRSWHGYPSTDSPSLLEDPPSLVTPGSSSLIGSTVQGYRPDRGRVASLSALNLQPPIGHRRFQSTASSAGSTDFDIASFYSAPITYEGTERFLPAIDETVTGNLEDIENSNHSPRQAGTREPCTNKGCGKTFATRDGLRYVRNSSRSYACC